jgi:multiple sugar transport system substrate-binding protein
MTRLTNRYVAGKINAKRLVQLLVVALGLIIACGPAGAQEPVELTFMFRGGELQEQLVHHWIAEFEAENPDIKINWRIASGDWMDQMPIWIASGTAPDVFEMWGRQARDWGENGFLLDLAPYVARDFTQEEIDDFFPISWEASILNLGPRAGVQYGIPSYGNIYTFYYNKTLFDEAGVPHLDVLDQSGDWTWETLIEIGRKLTRSDGERIVQYALEDNSIQHPTARGAGWIAAAGGKIFDFPDNPTRFMMDEPEAIQGLQFMQDLIWQYQIVPPQDMLSQYDFRNGQAAMRVEGTGYLARMEIFMEGRWDFDLGPRPMGPVSRGYYLASDMFGISGTTKHPEEAWRFVKYLVGEKGMYAHMAIMGRGPARKSLYEDYQELYPNRSTIYHMLGMMEAVLSPETLMYESHEARRLIRDVAVRPWVMTGEKPAEQAIREIADAVRALYVDYEF